VRYTVRTSGAGASHCPPSPPRSAATCTRAEPSGGGWVGWQLEGQLDVAIAHFTAAAKRLRAGG
jgi:hypothetical protein